MKKLLFILPFSLVLFASSKIYAQKLFIGINSPLMFSYRVFNSSSDWFTKARNSSDFPLIKTGIGLQLEFHFENHFGIETGVNYTSAGYDFNITNFPVGDYMSPTEGYQFPVTREYNFLDVPFMIRYYTDFQKFNFLSGLGIVNRFLLNEGDGSFSYNRRFYNISPIVSIGGQYILKNKHLFKLETFGLIDLFYQPEIQPTSSVSTSVNLFQIGLRICYSIGIH